MSRGSSPRGRRHGPEPRWGRRAPCTINWPAEHRETFEKEAADLGLSLNEYVIRRMASAHGLLEARLDRWSTGTDEGEETAGTRQDRDDGPEQLTLSA